MINGKEFEKVKDLWPRKIEIMIIVISEMVLNMINMIVDLSTTLIVLKMN